MVWERSTSYPAERGMLGVGFFGMWTVSPDQCYLKRGSLRYGNMERERSTSYPAERGTLGVDFFGLLGRNEIRLFRA